MRRTEREIKDRAAILNIMKKCDVCRLALNDEGYPYILPLNFGMEATEENIILYFHGAIEGKKYELIQKDSRASFEMDCSHRLVIGRESCACTMEYESVIGRGIIEILSEEEKSRALRILMQHYYKEDLPISQAMTKKTAVMKLTVEKVTGKGHVKRNEA